MKKTIAFLLCAIMLLGMISCKRDKQPAEQTDGGTQTGEPTGTTAATDEWGQDVIDREIPESLNFNGATVNIMIRKGEQYRREWCEEGEPTDALSNEIYNRNNYIQERLGVYFNFIPVEEGKNNETFNQRISNVGKAQLSGIDIVSNYAAYAATPELVDYYADFYDSKLTYIKLDKNYWNQNFIKSAEMFGRLYYAVGDVNLSVFDRSIVTFFNQTQCDNRGITDLYKTVLDGEWTYEKLYQLSHDVYEDRGAGDKAKDFYGLTSILWSEASDGFLYSFGCRLTETAEDGTHHIVTGSNLQKLSDSMEKIQKLCYAEGTYMHKSSMDNYVMFTENRALFDIDVVYHYKAGNQMMREMTDHYGLLPVPKYDSAQTEYYTGVQDAHNVMSVMNHPKQDYEMISAVLETFCAESYERVRPYYFEKIVKMQYLKDEESGQVFDLVLAGTRWDVADVYSMVSGNVRNKIWRGPFQKKAELMTEYSTYVDSLNEKLSEMDTWLMTQS